MKYFLLSIMVTVSLQAMDGNDSSTISTFPGEVVKNIVKQLSAHQVLRACCALKCSCTTLQSLFYLEFEKDIIDSYGERIDLMPLIRGRCVNFLDHMRKLGCCGLNTDSKNKRLLNLLYNELNASRQQKEAAENIVTGRTGPATEEEANEAWRSLEEVKANIKTVIAVSRELRVDRKVPVNEDEITIAQVGVWARQDNVSSPFHSRRCVAAMVICPVVIVGLLYLLGYYITSRV